MKKAALLIFLCIMICVSFVSLTVSPNAEASFPTEVELETLVDDGLLVRSMLGARRYPWDYENGDLQMIYVFEEKDGFTFKFKYVYRPVIEGFEEEDIKALVRKTLTEQYADEVLARNNAFFDNFREIDGTMCFKEEGYTLSNGYREYPRDKDRDIVVVEKTDERAAIDVFFQPDLTVRIYLENENGSWKISSYDNKRMLLTADPEVMKQNDFSADMALEAIKAVIMEGYYFTSINDHDTNTYYELAGGSAVLEGSLARPETWKQYLAGFSTSEVADSVLFKNGKLTLKDGGLLERHADTGNIDMYLSSNALSADRLTLTSKDGANATCVYDLGYGDKDVCSLTVEFSKTDSGWRVSGGNFIETLQNTFHAGNPGTSDTGVFAIVTVILLLPAVMLKKRRG